MNFYQRYTTLQATLYLHWCHKRSPIVTQKKTVLPKSTYYSFNQLNAAHAIFCELSAALTKSCNSERPLRMRSSYDIRKRYLRLRQFRQRKLLYYLKLAISENFYTSTHAPAVSERGKDDGRIGLSCEGGGPLSAANSPPVYTLYTLYSTSGGWSPSRTLLGSQLMCTTPGRPESEWHLAERLTKIMTTGDFGHDSWKQYRCQHLISAWQSRVHQSQWI